MAQPEQGQSAAALLARLMSSDWRERQEALDELQLHTPPDLARALLELLSQNHVNLHDFISALQALERVGSPLIAELIDLLHSPDLDLRVAVPLVLGALDGPDAEEALAKAAADPNQPENVRFNAVEALARLRSPDSLDTLLAILEESSPFLRYAVVVALGELGRAEAEPHILPLLKDARLAEPALSALAQVGSVRSVEGITRWMLLNPDRASMVVGAVAAIAARSPAPAEVQRIFVASAGTAGQRRVLALSLPGAVDFAASDPCWSALAEVTSWVLELGQAGPEARSALARLMADPGARRTAEAALARNPGPAPVELVEALNSADADHALSAARVLAASGDSQALPALAALLRRDEESLAAVGAEGLGNIGGPQALASLTAALAHPKPYVRRVAVTALARMNAPGLSAQASALLEHADSGVREAALRLLAQVDPPAAARAALAASQDSAAEVRRAGLEIAARGGDARALDLLAAAFSDADAGTRRAAVQAAAGLPAEAALPLMLRALAHKDGWVRVYAARGLGQLPSAEALDGLSACLRDPFPPVRSAAVQALARIASQGVATDLRASLRGLLQSALADDSPEVRQAAADALEAGGPGGV